MAGVSGPFSPVQSCSELSRTRACFPFRVFRGKNHRCLLLSNGGEGEILVLPFPASADESYTSAIIPCVLDAYKRFLSSATVSIVSPIRWSSAENGISGISSNWLQLWPSHWRQSEQHQLHHASSARAASEIHWEEKKGPFGNSSQLRSVPMRGHNSIHGVRIRTEQQVSNLVS